jgi:hypothetical protein
MVRRDRQRRCHRLGAALALAALVLAPPLSARQNPPRVNPLARSFSEIQERVQAYVALHRQLDAELPALAKQATAEEIQAHQRALSRRLQQARGDAGAGSVFTRESRGVVRGVLKAVFAGPDGGHIKKVILDEYPGGLRVRANMPYPDNVPLSSIPPPVLAALPSLPPEVEYRFIGRTLILLDIESRLVIDLVDNAIP